MLYLVSYDISDDDEDYSAVFNKLKAKKATNILKSQWIVDEDETTAKDLANSLLEGLKGKVLLLVNSWDCHESYSTTLLNNGEKIKPLPCRHCGVSSESLVSRSLRSLHDLAGRTEDDQEASQSQ